MRSRALATLLVSAAGAGVAVLGVTWAADGGPPRLERTSSATLYDDVVLTPGAPVVRCASLTPRGAALTGLGFDGHATGSLASTVRIRIERGSGTASATGDCTRFVPVDSVFDGGLDAMPSEASRAIVPVAIARDQAIVYRGTMVLPQPASGATAFALRITGAFADAPRRPRPGDQRDAPDEIQDIPRCLQLRTGNRVQRSRRVGGVRLVVRTPRSLPITVVRPLPVYVTTTRHDRPAMRAGNRRVRLRRTVGGRWLGHVPIGALAAAQGVRVTSGRVSVAVAIRNRPCAFRVRTFLRVGDTVDLRIDARNPIAGAAARLPRALGRPTGGAVTVRTLDGARVTTTRGHVGPRGRGGTRRLPGVRIAGTTVEVLDLPPAAYAVSVRLRVPGADRIRRTVCRGNHVTLGRLVTRRASGLHRYRLRSRLAIIGDRCPHGS